MMLVCVLVIGTAVTGCRRTNEGTAGLAPEVEPTTGLVPQQAESHTEPTARAMPAPSPGSQTPEPELESAPDNIVATPEGHADISIHTDQRLASGPVPYGTNGWWFDQDADMWKQRYSELAPQIVRLPIMQGVIEPVNDNDDPRVMDRKGFRFDESLPWFDRTVTMRRWLETLRDQNITVMLNFPYLAGWLSANSDRGWESTYPPNSLDEYAEFLRASLTFVIREVGYPPERVILEPVNEPDLGCGQDPAVPCFWENWVMDDLVAVMRTARQVADEIDPAIRVVGLSTCCNEGLLPQFMADHGGTGILDGITYHRYENQFDQAEAIRIGRWYQEWGLPVYLNEYGSTIYWSNGLEGALWHAAALPHIWSAGIAPIQFAMAEIPGMHQGYNELGLFYDGSRNWEKKPAYHIYTAFFGRLAPAIPVATDIADNVPIIATAGRHDDGHASIWMVNADRERSHRIIVDIHGLPSDQAIITVYDVLADQQIAQFHTSGQPIRFVQDVAPLGILVFETSPGG